MEDLEENQRREQCHNVEIDLFAEDGERKAGLRNSIANILMKKLQRQQHNTISHLNTYTEPIVSHNMGSHLHFGVTQCTEKY